jgi:hypothetical protein
LHALLAEALRFPAEEREELAATLLDCLDLPLPESTLGALCGALKLV